MSAARRVLHVVDLNNEGSSVRDYWLPLVTRQGAGWPAWPPLLTAWKKA